MTLLIVAVVIILVASYEIAKRTGGDDAADTSEPAPLASTSTNANAGSHPYPRVPRLLAGGIEIVDLRVLPRRQRQAGFQCVAEQLRAASPYVARCFVVDAQTMEEWLKLDGFVATLLGGQLKRAAHATKIFVHAPGMRALTDADNAQLATIGVEYAVQLKHVEPDRTIDLLPSASAPAPHEWIDPVDKRPSPGSQCWGESTFSTDLVTQIAPFAFVDLRRASAALRTNPEFATRFASMIAPALASPDLRPTEVIWVLGPWILDEWCTDPNAAQRLVDLAAPFRRFGPQRLAITDVSAEEKAALAQNQIVKQLDKHGFRPVDSRFEWKTTSGQRFVVDPVTALEDAYCLVAWQADTRVGKKSPN